VNLLQGVLIENQQPHFMSKALDAPQFLAACFGKLFFSGRLFSQTSPNVGATVLI